MPQEATTSLDQLLKGKAASSFSSSQLSGKAHYRWSRDQLWEAFLLFDAAAQRATEEGNQNAFEAARNRAAITLHRSGRQPNESLLRLEAVLQYYESHPQRDYDSHLMEWAAMELLEHQFSENPSGFAVQFQQIRSRCASGGRTGFPWMFPHAERVAQMAVEASVPSVVLLAVSRLEEKKPMPRTLRKKIDAWSRWAASVEKNADSPQAR